MPTNSILLIVLPKHLLKSNPIRSTTVGSLGGGSRSISISGRSSRTRTRDRSSHSVGSRSSSKSSFN